MNNGTNRVALQRREGCKGERLGRLGARLARPEPVEGREGLPRRREGREGKKYVIATAQYSRREHRVSGAKAPR
ncbi:hypothetical protein [Anaerolinea sp.]|uniref:hypothetical protein n=1 Tax=Anaerolinea sp. TaxID=1872519 RepID=UPI002ACEF82B|nr:hypothetical protein [Anaerolinea sp.]